MDTDLKLPSDGFERQAVESDFSGFGIIAWFCAKARSGKL